MRKVTATLIALVVLFAGALLGFVIAQEFSRDRLFAYEMANVDHMSTYVMVQRFQGTPHSYETALHDFLVSLDERERAGHGLLSEQILAGDRALTYIRLSLLASQRNELEAAATYRSKAEMLCPQTGWKSCSADEMITLVRRLDEQSMWNPSRQASGHGS